MTPKYRLAHALSLMSAFGFGCGDIKSRPNQPSRELTDRDLEKLAQAKAKRERRAPKRIAQARL